MKTILYATDRSKHDISILQYAYELSQKLKANLILLHVYSFPPVQFSTIRPRKRLGTHVRDEQLTVLKEYAAKNLPQSEIKTEIGYEVIENISVSEGILTKIEELSPDLLLVGMKDEHTARGIFSGSIAKALLTKVHCPFLIVPNTQLFRGVNTIVYASDFEEGDIFAIQRLVEVALPFKAKIKIVHISTKNETMVNDQMAWFKEMLQQQVAYKNISFEISARDTIYDGLRGYLNTSNADIVALLEREEHGFLEKLFHKDLVKELESNIPMAMLSFSQAHV